MDYVRISVLFVTAVCADYTEKDAVQFLKEYSEKSQKLWSVQDYALWDYQATLSDKAQQALQAAQQAYDKYQIDRYPEVLKFNWTAFQDPAIKRQFKFISKLDEAALPVAKRTRLSELITEMVDIYSKTKLKKYKSTDNATTLSIDDIADIMAQSRDPCELTYYWDGWQTTVGEAVKSRYKEYVELENEVAKLNNFTDTAERWHDKFETSNFEEEMARLMADIRPLYRQLHAYVRHQLWLFHGKNDNIINLAEAIPASLMANPWALDGINVYNYTAPFKNKPSLDVTPALVAQNYTGLKMARAAEQFYLSLNMSSMTDKFWKYSILERPAKGDIDCSPTAYPFYNDSDFRILICSEPTLDFYGRMHHEMGHIENYMLWAKLEWFFRDAPNPGFDEAIGDMIYLFSVTPTHLKTVGLLPSTFQVDKEQEINALYQQALAVVFFLPYAYSLDLFRWQVFRGQITPDKYNSGYWKIRIQEHGVSPPVLRDDKGFDAGAKYHVVNDYQYISYFVSGILEFQFLKGLCGTAGKYNHSDPSTNPLYLCDIYGSNEAGNKLKSMMSLGKSKVWPEALKIVTGQDKMDSSALLEFFQPLYQWLVEENKRTGQKVGWTTKESCGTETTLSQCRYK